MEKRIRRIEILVVILLLFSLANLTIPIVTNNSKAEGEAEEIIETKELPPDLNRPVLDKIAYSIKTKFNEGEWNKLYNIYGDFAKAQLSPEHIESEFIKMKNIIGNIGTYAYSHYVYEGVGENADWFEIQYKCLFKNGKGTIKISTRTLDGISEVTGINIVLDDI